MLIDRIRIQSAKEISTVGSVATLRERRDFAAVTDP